ncbi:MAG: hypothetical protein AAGI03_18215, partial [Pseudomonadota bacterium]
MVRARMGDDEDALRRLARRQDIRDLAKGGAALKLLWEVCQVPDFRKVTPDEHASLLGDLYHQMLERGRIDAAWAESQLRKFDHIKGDVDALSHRIAHVRTWTYLSHRPGWLDDAAHFQGEARRIEDRLSDALHEKLTQRFVDRRTSLLLKRLKDEAPLLAGVRNNGEVVVEGEFVGRLIGFQFILDPKAKGPHAKPVRFAALKALGPELLARAEALAAAKPADFSLDQDGSILWRGSIIAQLTKGPQPLRPDFRFVAMEHMPAQAVASIEQKLRDVIADRVEGLAGPLVGLQRALGRPSEDPEALSPGARGLAYRLVENFGAFARRPVAEDIKALTQDERAGLRKLGVRFGEYTLHLPALLKPAPAQFLGLLWALWTEKDPSAFPHPPAGATSVPAEEAVPHGFWYAVGYRPSGTRAVRIDMLERLAQEIRQAREAGGKEGFEVTQRMMSLVGVSGDTFEDILKNLGYKKATVTRPKKAQEPQKAAASKDQPNNQADSPKADAAEAKPAESDSSETAADTTFSPSDSDTAPATEAATLSAPQDNKEAPSVSSELQETPLTDDQQAEEKNSDQEAPQPQEMANNADTPAEAAAETSA